MTDLDPGNAKVSAPTANQEKEAVARSSVFAAILLTSTKTIVGLMTGSLGILSEALHSTLDLVAAIITWIAVKFSGKPADEDHLYGHGKVESLSALAEIILLMLTCFWIVLEAVERLSGKHAPIEVNIWSFGVMLLSIAVDITRSRALYKVAAKHNSQALEADALHFSSDIVSSVVVILGLIFATFGYPKADPIAALGVALLVAIASVRLGREALSVLMDKAPAGMAQNIFNIAMGVAGVLNVKNIRVRGTGAESFAELTVAMRNHMAFEEAHGLSHQVENAILEKYPRCHTQVHMEPASGGSEDLFIRIRRSALCQQGVINLHNLELSFLKNQWHVVLHLEVDENMLLSDAHRITSELEKNIQKLDPKIGRVVSHIEPAPSNQCVLQEMTETSQSLIAQIKSLAQGVPDLHDFHNIRIFAGGNRQDMEMHVRTAGNISVAQAHKLSTACEEKIRRELPQFSRITIHTEPLKSSAH